MALIALPACMSGTRRWPISSGNLPSGYRCLRLRSRRGGFAGLGQRALGLSRQDESARLRWSGSVRDDDLQTVAVNLRMRDGWHKRALPAISANALRGSAGELEMAAKICAVARTRHRSSRRLAPGSAAWADHQTRSADCWGRERGSRQHRREHVGHSMPHTRRAAAQTLGTHTTTHAAQSPQRMRRTAERGRQSSTRRPRARADVSPLALGVTKVGGRAPKADDHLRWQRRGAASAVGTTPIRRKTNEGADLETLKGRGRGCASGLHDALLAEQIGSFI
jgi:hypothetical protein